MYLVLCTGATNGLSLTLNIEEYDYMKGPHMDAGVKVHVLHIHTPYAIGVLIHETFVCGTHA